MNGHDIDDLDFSMLTLTVRPGPCRKAAAEETDATAARLERERIAHVHMAIATKCPGGPDDIVNGRMVDYKTTGGVEVKYGSGKVKV